MENREQTPDFESGEDKGQTKGALACIVTAKGNQASTNDGIGGGASRGPAYITPNIRRGGI